MKKNILLGVFLYFCCNSYVLNAQNYYISTARPKNEMEQVFPFDISLKSPEGKIVNSKKLFKKHTEPTVFLFWLTTCYPCKMEIAAIQQKYADWAAKEKFRIVLISYDFPNNYDNFVKRAQEEKWPWESYHDINKEFGVILPGELNGLPQVFIFDKEGQIAYHKRKYNNGDEDLIFEKIKTLNAQP
jgi:cytochrome c biogenesis protein CcmG, thiol:disulfide interchange protein DsbE